MAAPEYTDAEYAEFDRLCREDDRSAAASRLATRLLIEKYPQEFERLFHIARGVLYKPDELEPIAATARAVLGEPDQEEDHDG